MKSMLRKHCHDSQKAFHLFCLLPVSLGCSPADLVFGHEVRDPLKVLKEHLVMPEKRVNGIPEYVTKLKDRLQLEMP